MTPRSELDRKFLAAVERLGRALRVARQQIATSHEISVLQMQILEHLADGQPRRVGDIAAELDVTQPTVSDALTSLEDKRVVARRRASVDGRVVEITLTGSGTTLAATIASELEPLVVGPRSTSELDEAQALHVLLDEITRLQEQGVISVNRSCLTCTHYAAPSTGGAGHCLLLDRPLQDRDLRVDCPEHDAALSPA